MSIESLILSLSYFGLFAMMTLLGLTGIFPPSKLVYIAAGYFVFTGYLNLYYTIIVGSLGHTLGNYFQFLLAKKHGLKFFEKWNFFPQKEIKKFQIAFNKRKILWLFLGKILDPIKFFISICAAIAKVPLKLFLPFALLGSIIWATTFTLFGFYFGQSYEHYGILGIIILILGGAVIFSFYKFMNSEIIEKEL